jgi:hypothetical protein
MIDLSRWRSRTASGPPSDLEGDLRRAVAWLEAARAARDAELFGFRYDTRGAALDPSASASANEEAALRECLKLGSIYWRQTFQSGHKRSPETMAARIRVLMDAYAKIVEACPGVIDHIRAGSPGFAEAIEWIKSCASGRLPS